MSLINLRVLDGADRGRVFANLNPPITVGREEGNAVQLNDDRVSRFHLKIQEDDDQLVLTDLESTNGTKINGEDIQLRILKHGDLIMLGRSVLLFGSREEIATRLASIRQFDLKATSLDDEDIERVTNASCLDFELSLGASEDLQATLHVLQPPELPTRLSPGQAAQLSEMIEYFHIRIRGLLNSVQVAKGERVSLDQRQWQNLIDIQSRLSIYQRRIGEPNDD
jgi:pSer/pThr/pTyr-binding forkhead associated (FHA) protein